MVVVVLFDPGDIAFDEDDEGIVADVAVDVVVVVVTAALVEAGDDLDLDSDSGIGGMSDISSLSASVLLG